MRTRISSRIKISGSTKIAGIFGYPIEHTLSPIMHNSAYKALGLNYCYIPFLVHPEQLEVAVKAIRALNICGVNVTVPHKERIIDFIDKIDEEASFIGAVNTIVNLNGELIGYNTDGKGFIQSLLESNMSLDDKNVLIIGAGGASRAISYYLCQRSKTLYIYNRTRERAERLIYDLQKICDNVFLCKDINSSLEKFNIIINATPLGLNREDPCPLDTSLLNKNYVICDLIYKRTPLLKIAEKKGCHILDGSGMLLWQGVFAFELMTHKKPPIEIMRNALRKYRRDL